MRNKPTEKYHHEELERLNAAPWMVNLLNLNPDYNCWGPYEDYMCDKKSGWAAPAFSDSWKSFGPWGLDELNELVNFYFEIGRASKECTTCGGDGYHPKAHQVVNSFYAHSSETGDHWNDKITQDEADALVEAGRLNGPIAAEEVNRQQGRGHMGHDAINRSILIEARLTRLGLPKTCETCEGNGYVFTAESAHVNLILWFLHPRKGCSRGVEVKNIQESDLPSVYAYLKTAAKRNADRFAQIPN